MFTVNKIEFINPENVLSENSDLAMWDVIVYLKIHLFRVWILWPSSIKLCLLGEKI